MTTWHSREGRYLRNSYETVRYIASLTNFICPEMTRNSFLILHAQLPLKFLFYIYFFSLWRHQHQLFTDMQNIHFCFIEWKHMGSNWGNFISGNYLLEKYILLVFIKNINSDYVFLGWIEKQFRAMPRYFVLKSLGKFCKSLNFSLS